MKLREYQTIRARRKAVEKKLGFSLSAISFYPKKLEKAQFKNCENMIGAVQVPLGIAGPVKIQGQFAKGEYFLPLSTSEGALVASVNRGCKAVSRAGGVWVFSEDPGISRGAIFLTRNLEEGFRFKKWLEENWSLLSAIPPKISSHLQLKKIKAQVLGRNVFVRFSFDSSEAMGMNMATLAVEKISQFIAEKLNLSCLAVAGNFDLDKKPAWLNFILGRGRQVWAEAFLAEKIVREVLKTTPAKIHEVAVKKCLLGSGLSGSLGFNGHFANIIAALFLATGQDLAHVVEGSLGITATEIIGQNLYFSVFLPDLPLGTVGGGTGLPAQIEALKILGVKKREEKGQALFLAEIIGAAVLAGELSLLASLAEGTLGLAHSLFARGKNLR